MSKHYFEVNQGKTHNAHFIVHACNAHDDLVAALKRVTDALESLVRSEYEGTTQLDAQLVEVVRARAALAKVRP